MNHTSSLKEDKHLCYPKVIYKMGANNNCHILNLFMFGVNKFTNNKMTSIGGHIMKHKGNMR